MTPAEGVEALLAARERLEKATIELAAAEAEVNELEKTILPPIFLQARVSSVELPNKAKATKSLYAHARLAKEGPARKSMLDWLEAIGENNSLSATLVADWPRGQIQFAKQVADSIRDMDGVGVKLVEDIHWKTLEAIVLREVKSGKHEVPIGEMGVTVGDRVQITRYPDTVEQGDHS